MNNVIQKLQFKSHVTISPVWLVQCGKDMLHFPLAVFDRPSDPDSMALVVRTGWRLESGMVIPRNRDDFHRFIIPTSGADPMSQRQCVPLDILISRANR